MKKTMEFEVNVFLNTLFFFLLCVAGTLIFEDVKNDFSDDGVWGFLQWKNAPVCFLANAFLGCFWCIYGYVLALKFYE